MSSYLERLKRLAEKKHLPEHPSKPPKGAYNGFDGSRGKAFCSDAGAYDGFDGSHGECFSPTPVAGKDKPQVVIETPVVMTVPAGDDAFVVARTLIKMARAQDAAGELPAGRSYRFRLVDQRAADRRNAEAVRAGLTDRYCACGALATFAWPDDDGRAAWRCLECGPVRGRA